MHRRATRRRRMTSVPIGSPAIALERQLAVLDRRTDPDGWALLAGRVALARAELGDPSGALALIEPAAAVLTAARAPLEHGRLLLIAAAAHRAQGAGAQAFDLFQRAAAMLDGRASAGELAAARSNVGLVAAELGRVADALGAFDAALSAAPDEDRRLRASLHVNRGQVHLASPGAASLSAAEADFRSAAALADRTAAPVQHGQAKNGLGAIAQARGDLAGAAVHFEAAMATFTPTQFPFHHAVASHNLGLALSDPNFPVVVRQRALVAFEGALTLFDPQRQRPQWAESYRRATDLEASLAVDLPDWSRDDHFAALLAEVSESDRIALARTRLGHIAQRPDPHRRRAFALLAAAGLRRGPAVAKVVLRCTVTILMELPEDVLQSGLSGQMDAHHALLDPRLIEDADRVLDEAIHDLLHGPQRVRVRDLLEVMGWQRP